MPQRFITFEGGEGVGKSTQLRLLAATLRTRGHTVVETREPGGCPAAEQVRTLLVTGSADRWDAVAEAFLVSAARRMHVEQVIRPALERGAWVLCDRFTDSTIVYQGLAGGVGTADLQTLNRLATNGLAPDLTLVFTLSVDRALERATRRAAASGSAEDRFEGKGRAFHDALARGFDAVIQAEPNRCRRIDADGSVETVAHRVLAAVDAA
ncbi:MAG: dTMP kinase [Alphaproteobacteria bacterium]|nr:MAG: dTMP kinase [Alphaproteobacteria bacterium]